MRKNILRVTSMLLVITMLLNWIPLVGIAANEPTKEIERITTEETAEQQNAAVVVEEIVDKRTEYTKWFRMDNGLYAAAVYSEPVHYEKDGAWVQIDNTLQASADGGIINTAGIWDVEFPNQMSAESSIHITKDGYTLAFSMGGELHSGRLEVSSEIISAQTEGKTEETFDTSQAQTSVAQIQKPDPNTLRQTQQNDVMAVNTITSALVYESVYSGTDVRYDLQSNQIKESVILDSYNSTLRGYRYQLSTGELIPVLGDDGRIEFYDPQKQNVVMVMEAPFLTDAAMVYNYDVQVQLSGNDGNYTLTYLLPHQWLASQERQWPVILDPVISAKLDELNIRDRTVASNATFAQNWGMNACGYSKAEGKQRFYLKYREIPALTSADVVVGATIQMYKYETSGTTATVQVHKVLGTWESETITWANKPAYDETVEDFNIVREQGFYGWDVTDIVRGWYEGENYGMMFRVEDAVENGTTANYKQFISSDYSYNTLYMPSLTIFFRNNNGLESYWDYSGSSAGRAGTGYVNNYTGNLVWVRSDIGFGGNRMPVAISHIYNANDSLSVTDSNNVNDTSGNGFGLGQGWRTNYNQLVYQWSQDSSYYVWEDSDGTDHYFYLDTESGEYVDEDGLELKLDISGAGTKKYTITDKNGNKSYFDTQGRLTSLENNQATPSAIRITYVDSSKKIATITDGANRVYTFIYNTDGQLSKISYQKSGETDQGHVTFAYDSAKRLTSVTDQDGKVSRYTYGTNNLLTSAQDIDGYKLTYTYTTTTAKKPARVSKILESHNGVLGGELNITYQHNQTTFTDVNGNIQIMQFNSLGNTISIQDGQGRAQYAQYAKNDTEDETHKGNQLTLASKLQNTVGNYLPHSSFEMGHYWAANSSELTITTSNEAAYQGQKSLKLQSTSTGQVAALAPSQVVEPGETVTFSAYIKSVDATGLIALHYGGDYTNYVGPGFKPGQNWTRLEVSYTNNTNTSRNMICVVFIQGSGTAYVDAAQMEKAPTASRLNLIENGDFRIGYSGVPALCWTGTGLASADQLTTLDAAANPQLNARVFSITGSPTAKKRLGQTVKISGSAQDTFVLAGWAKGNSVPTPEAEDGANQRRFALMARFNYTDGTNSDYFYAHFNPDSNAWQYAATAMVAQKAYSSVSVWLVYDYNMNTVFFDGIQLFRENFGSSYTYDEDGNVISVVDLQKKTTTYEYDEESNLTKILQDNQAKMIYTYDDYHNVLTAQSQEGLLYTFAYDAWGNNTAVSIGSGDTKLTSTAQYTTDGNRLASTTDAAGKITRYGYNSQTNVLEWVQYPEDTEATRTNYTYDSMYRLAQVEVQTDTNTAMSAAYTYENDLLTELDAGGTVYTFAYGNFALRSSIQVGDQTLATYTYTQDRNNYLASMNYGNGDSISYTYDDLGRLVTQTYEDGATVTYRYDNNGALVSVKDSTTGRTIFYYYDFTDRLVKYKESGSGHSFSMVFTYNNKNQVIEAQETTNGYGRYIWYTYDDDNRLAAYQKGWVKQNYHYDAYGRVDRKNLTFKGANVLTTTHAFRTTDHGATSQVVTLQNSYGGQNTVYSYTYDENGNILTVSDGTHTLSYVYDSQNQLLRENNQAAGYTLAWTYDGQGNVLTETEYPFTQAATLGNPVSARVYHYTDADWPDLLTGVTEDGVYREITSDEIGNPLSDGVRTYTWKHGRQLATVTQAGVTWTNTYNADGMRISRTNGTVTYGYNYYGGQLLSITKNGEAMYFSYTPDGLPMALAYQSTSYIYVTNLQGDVVAILDTNGVSVVEYTYDAWGKLLSCTGSMASTLGQLNPLRYRGYVYDSETDLYYLQSRYYDPTLRRFVNADGLTATGQGIIGNNMFVYCLNNPIMRDDPSGNRCVPQRADLKAFIPEYILDQEDGSIANKKLGVSTISHSGCGVIATYNALLTLGENTTFDEVLAYYNKNWYSLDCAGLAGMRPDVVATYFREAGYTVHITDSRDGIDVLSRSADACILYYMYYTEYSIGEVTWDLYGAHFVSYLKKGGKYITLEAPTDSFKRPSSYAYSGRRFYAIGIYIYK